MFDINESMNEDGLWRLKNGSVNIDVYYKTSDITDKESPSMNFVSLWNSR
jgi:hypothetical protein